MEWFRPLLVIAALAGISFFFPDSISDKNAFLKDFIDNDLIATLGVVASITLASISNLHLQLNSISERQGISFDHATRGLRASAKTLIFSFAATVLLAVLKPIFPHYSLGTNALAIFIVYINLEILWDITSTTLAIPAGDKSQGLGCHKGTQPIDRDATDRRSPD